MLNYSKWENQLSKAKKFKDMTPIALEILKQMPQEITQVCGPISTGGITDKIDKEKNILIFSSVIEYLNKHGHNVFNQIFFEKHVQRIWEETVDGYPTELLETFYLPLFKSGMIKYLIFLPRWETSIGSVWEMKQALKLGINTLVLSEKEFYFARKYTVKT